MKRAAIVAKFNVEDIKRQTEEVQRNIFNTIVEQLCKVGEDCINEARNGGTYKDITGNLRSSIGYTVLSDGEEVQTSDFKRYPPTDEKKKAKTKKDGVKEGKDLLNELKTKYPKGLVLIMVAGMNYAVYVEDLHGLNVLNSSYQLAKEKMKNLMQTINSEIENL